MKKNITLFISIILLPILFISCATFKNTKDLYLEDDYQKLGSISLLVPTWSWTNFSKDGNEEFNKKMYDKLYKKAESKYGNNIDLINVVIKDSVGTNIGIHAGALVGGSVAAYAINGAEKMQSNNNEDLNYSYALLYLLTLGKFVKVSADVIVKPNYNLDDGIFINIKEYREYSKRKHLTNNTTKPKTTEYKTEENETKSNIVEEYDEFKKTSFIKNKKIENQVPVDIYIGKNEETKWLRIRFRYRGSDWIFFDKITIINSEGATISWNINTFDKNTDVLSNGSVYESIDLQLSDSKKEELYSLLQGDGVKIRLSGKYYSDYNIKTDYASALLEVLNTYNEL